jgi:hypothetical protein
MDEDLAQAAVRHAIRGDEHRETLWQIRSKNRGGCFTFHRPFVVAAATLYTLRH